MISIGSHIYDPAAVVALTRLDTATTLHLVSGDDLVIADPPGMDLWQSMLDNSAIATGPLDHALAYAGVDLSKFDDTADDPDPTQDPAEPKPVSLDQSTAGAVWLDPHVLAAMSRVLTTAVRAVHNDPQPGKRVPCTILMVVYYQQQLNPPLDPQIDVHSSRQIDDLDRTLAGLGEIFGDDTSIRLNLPLAPTGHTIATTPPSK
jgi:hypothetical protein